jgi:hypothetical protein
MDAGSHDRSIHQIVEGVLVELGLPEQACLGTRVLVRDGYCVARVLLLESLRVVWRLDTDDVEFRDLHGRLLKHVSLAAQENVARAA